MKGMIDEQDGKVARIEEDLNTLVGSRYKHESMSLYLDFLRACWKQSEASSGREYRREQ